MRSQCRGLTVKQFQLQVPVTFGFIIQNNSGCRKFSTRKSISCRSFFGTTCTLSAFSGRDILSHLPPRAIQDPTLRRVDSVQVHMRKRLEATCRLTMGYSLRRSFQVSQILSLDPLKRFMKFSTCLE